jgi:hypothetical protein
MSSLKVLTIYQNFCQEWLRYRTTSYFSLPVQTIQGLGPKKVNLTLVRLQSLFYLKYKFIYRDLKKLLQELLTLIKMSFFVLLF